MSQSEGADLTHIRHFPRFVEFLHVLQKNLLGLKCKLTDLANGCNNTKIKSHVWFGTSTRTTSTFEQPIFCHT